MSTQDAIDQLITLQSEFAKLPEKDQFYTDLNIITLCAESVERVIIEYYNPTRPDIGKSFLKALGRIKMQGYNNLTKLGDLKNVINDAIFSLKGRLKSNPEVPVQLYPNKVMNQVPSDLQEAIIKIINDNGLVKSDFLRTTSFSSDRSIFTFNYRESLMHFSFVQSKTDFDQFFVWFTWCTPDNKLDKREREFLNTEQALSFFDDWIKGHLMDFKRKFESPDPWTLAGGPIKSVVTPWQRINELQSILLEQYQSADDPVLFQSVGVTSRTILQELAAIVFKPEIHKTVEEMELGESFFKNRFKVYIRSEIKEGDNKEFSKVIESLVTTASRSIDLSNKVTHDLKAYKLFAETCVISVVSVVQLIKLIDNHSLLSKSN